MVDEIIVLFTFTNSDADITEEITDLTKEQSTELFHLEPNGKRVLAFADWAIIHNISSIVSLGMALWKIYQIFKSKNKRQDAKMIIAIDPKNGVICELGPNSNYTAFMDDFEMKVTENIKNDKDGVQTKDIISEIRMSGLWIRKGTNN